MFHKLLTSIVLFVLVSCSEPPAAEPPIPEEQTSETEMAPEVVASELN